MLSILVNRYTEAEHTVVVLNACTLLLVNLPISDDTKMIRRLNGGNYSCY